MKTQKGYSNAFFITEYWLIRNFLSMTRRNLDTLTKSLPTEHMVPPCLGYLDSLLGFDPWL